MAAMCKAEVGWVTVWGLQHSRSVRTLSKKLTEQKGQDVTQGVEPCLSKSWVQKKKM
jgi:hypothetical protein